MLQMRLVEAPASAAATEELPADQLRVSRAWRSADGHAVAVAGPGLSARDRLAVHGWPDAAVALVRLATGTLAGRRRPSGCSPALR